MDHLHLVSFFVVSTWTGECCYVQPVQITTQQILQKSHAPVLPLQGFTSKEWSINQKRFRVCNYGTIQNILQRLQSLPRGKLVNSQSHFLSPHAWTSSSNRRLKMVEMLSHWWLYWSCKFFAKERISMPRPFHAENLLQVGVTRTELYSFNRIRMCWENPHPLANGTGGSSQANYSGPRQLGLV